MNLYYYSKKNLNYKRINISDVLKISLFLILFMLGLETNTNSTTLNEYNLNQESSIIFKSEDHYSEDKLKEEIQRMNFKFSNIVLAQAIHETNNFKSKIFIENNNLFGMKEAKSRNTLALGTQNNYAYYNNWKESLIDFGFWYSSYARTCKNEEEYFNLLSEMYAQDSLYVKKLKTIIKKI